MSGGAGEPLRLLYYVESLGLGGANQTTLTVACEMKARGHHVVFASDGGPLSDRLVAASIPHVPVATPHRRPSWRVSRALVRTVEEQRIDLICPNGFECTLDAVPAGLIARRPLLPTYGGLYNPPYPHPWLPRVNVFSHELSAELTAGYGWSPSTFRNLIARIDGDRFHPGIDGSALRRELGIESDRQLIVAVCRQDRDKLAGVLVLLQAAVEIRVRTPRAALVLFGDGDGRGRILERIEQIHRDTGETFIFAPGSTRDTGSAFAAADLVVANGARSALEAMACGRAVVSLGVNGFCGAISAETVEGFRRYNFDKGRLSGNPLSGRENLVWCVSAILSDPAVRDELERFSADYAGRHLLIQGAAPDFEALYREAIGDPWGGAGRTKLWANWLATVVRFHSCLLRRRIGRYRGAARGVEADRLVSPPPGLDPDWSIGLAGKVPR